MLSFLDAYLGYNQIHMNLIDRGLYCYEVMPFGLKNAEATYQRLVNQMFKKQIRQTMEVYVDDLLVKSKEPAQHLADLNKSFAVLIQYQMKLNLTKCAFRVDSGKFVGFIVSIDVSKLTQRR